MFADHKRVLRGDDIGEATDSKESVETFGGIPLSPAAGDGSVSEQEDDAMRTLRVLSDEENLKT